MGKVEQKLAIVGKPSGSRSLKKTVGRTAIHKRTARLSKAVGKVLEENADEIAQSLLDAALQGNVSCARLFLELAESHEGDPRQETRRGQQSQAMVLAMEPEWVSEATEITASICANCGDSQAEE